MARLEPGTPEINRSTSVPWTTDTRPIFLNETREHVLHPRTYPLRATDNSMVPGCLGLLSLVTLPSTSFVNNVGDQQCRSVNAPGTKRRTTSLGPRVLGGWFSARKMVLPNRHLFRRIVDPGDTHTAALPQCWRGFSDHSSPVEGRDKLISQPRLEG